MGIYEGKAEQIEKLAVERGDRMTLGRGIGILRNPPNADRVVATDTDAPEEPKHINMQRRIFEAMSRMQRHMEALMCRVDEAGSSTKDTTNPPFVPLPDSFDVMAYFTESCCEDLHNGLNRLESLLFER